MFIMLVTILVECVIRLIFAYCHQSIAEADWNITSFKGLNGLMMPCSVKAL